MELVHLGKVGKRWTSLRDGMTSHNADLRDAARLSGREYRLN